MEPHVEVLECTYMSAYDACWRIFQYEMHFREPCVERLPFHLWKAITTKLRSEGKIVLAVASCGIAALLLQGGRTAHSRFHIPLILTEESTKEYE